MNSLSFKTNFGWIGAFEEKNKIIVIKFRKQKNTSISKKLNQILLESNTYGNSTIGRNKKVNIEFVSANPTGPIHVAHIRGAVLGDVISSLLEASGYLVTREYYVNDTGTQITILGNSLFKRYQQLFGHKVNISEDEYPGEYLISLAQTIADLDNDIWLKKVEDKRKQHFEKFAISQLQLDQKPL